MKKMYLCCLLILLLSCDNKNQSNIPFEKINLAEKEILKEINDSTLHNVVGKNDLISDENITISVAEPVVFKEYGKENILKQRPYKIGKVQNYWVIYGSHPKAQIGGVFEIVINSNNGKIIRLSHGE